jgi:uncharacterized SAM-binding protein YcdF (DUF218 family)
VFFVLSKTLGVVILPTHFLLLIGLLGVLLLLTRFRALGCKCLALSIVLLAICAFSPLGNVLIYPLESRFPPWDASAGAPDGIIVLGGPIDANISMAHDAPVIRTAADRIVAGAALARKYPTAPVIFTGGSPDLISNAAREADYAAMVFESLGIDRARLIIERRSRNTLENAEFSKALADPKPGRRWLLVTSAFHMPRAVGLFRKAGFPVEAYPVDWRTGDKSDLLSFTTTATDGLLKTDIAVREWIGLVAYRLIGKTDDLLPGPSQD